MSDIGVIAINLFIFWAFVVGKNVSKNVSKKLANVCQ